MGISNKEIDHRTSSSRTCQHQYVEFAPRSMRPTEVTSLLADPSKAKKELCWNHVSWWSPTVSISNLDLRLFVSLLTHGGEVLKFMYDFQGSCGNNLAKRDLWIIKHREKILGTFRNIEGSEDFCWTRSYIQTVKKNGLNILESLKNAFLGHPFMPQSMAPSKHIV